MAFSKTPIADTYSSQKIPAAYDFDLRPMNLYEPATYNGDLTQDAGMVNLLPFKCKKPDGTEEIHAVTRPPMNVDTVADWAGDWIRGFYVWPKSSGSIYYFVVAGNRVYTSSSGINGPWTQVNTLVSASVDPVGFAEFIDSSTNTKKLVLCAGDDAYVYTSNAAGTQIVDPDFPNPHIPKPVFLNGRLYVAKANTGDIYNSDLNNPANWTAGNFISSELYADDIKALVRVNNYIMAIGGNACEFFYDAGNSPGSPLQRYEGGSLPFGTQLPDTIACSLNRVVFIADTNEGGFSLKLIEDFKVKELPLGPLHSALIARTQHALVTATELRGYFMHMYGDLYYGITLNGNVAVNSSNYNKSFAFHFNTMMWTELRFDSNQPFPVQFTSINNTYGSLRTYIAGWIGTAPFTGFMRETTDLVSIDSFITGPGVNTNVYTELRTPNLDFGTQNLKTMSRFGLEATTGRSTTSAVNLNVSWSDNDYTTYTTPVALDVGTASQFPFITQLGAFRRRSFKITYQGNDWVRYKYIICDINKGQQ